ncbi:MAG: transglycosylase SLT domain-containing protein [Polyangiaceae bacterium]|nr:transglycosylase SLT domain-containing protein [Polyangiaceae bacterium]
MPTRSFELRAGVAVLGVVLGATAGCRRTGAEQSDGASGSPPAASAEPGRAPEPPPSVVAVDWLPASVTHWRADIETAAAVHGLPADLVAIVVLVESGGDPAARSSSGARGLMQILPPTGRHIAGVRALADHADRRLVEPRYNLDLGAWYLARQRTDFVAADADKTVELVAAAYNGGPGRLARHLRGEGTLSAETERYIGWVGGMWRERRAPRSVTYAAWWDAGGSRLVTRAARALDEPVAPPP